MSEAKITLVGFTRYYEAMDQDLWEYLSFPAGIDKQTIIDNIMLNGGNFESYFPDPEYVKYYMGVWSRKWYWTFDKWYKAINIDYSPLDNYDRHEDYTDTNKGKDTHTASGSVDTITSLDSKTVDDSNTDTEHTVSAFDADTYQPKDKEKTDFDNTTSFESDGSSKTTTSDSKTIETGNTFEHHGHIHGNIGVTTSQQMLQSELDVALFNLYDRITDIFLREFIIPIY